MNKNSIGTYPIQLSYFLKASKYILAGICPSKGADRIHEVDDVIGVLSEVLLHHPFTAIVIVSVADKGNSYLKQQIDI